MLIFLATIQFPETLILCLAIWNADIRELNCNFSLVPEDKRYSTSLVLTNSSVSISDGSSTKTNKPIKYIPLLLDMNKGKS